MPQEPISNRLTSSQQTKLNQYLAAQRAQHSGQNDEAAGSQAQIISGQQPDPISEPTTNQQAGPISEPSTNQQPIPQTVAEWEAQRGKLARRSPQANQQQLLNQLNAQQSYRQPTPPPQPPSYPQYPAQYVPNPPYPAPDPIPLAKKPSEALALVGLILALLLGGVTFVVATSSGITVDSTITYFVIFGLGGVMLAIGGALIYRGLHYNQLGSGIAGLALAIVGMSMPFLFLLSITLSGLSSLRNNLGRLDLEARHHEPPHQPLYFYRSWLLYAWNV